MSLNKCIRNTINSMPSKNTAVINRSSGEKLD